MNQKLSAVRKLAAEAGYDGLLEPAAAQAIRDIHGAEQRGVRTGDWLTKRQAAGAARGARSFDNQGKRDRRHPCRAGRVWAAARRSRPADLRSHRAARRPLVRGGPARQKGRYRTVPMPAWTKTTIDSWSAAVGLTTGRVFRGVNKGDVVIGNV